MDASGTFGPDGRSRAYHPGMAWQQPPQRPPSPVPSGGRPMPALPPPRRPAVDPQGVAWSAVPIVTLGMGSPFSFVYAANRHRSGKVAAAGGGYGAGYVAVFTTALPVPLAIMLFMTLWVTSSVH